MKLFEKKKLKYYEIQLVSDSQLDFEITYR